MSQTTTFTRALEPRLDELARVRTDLRCWLRRLDVPPAVAEDVVLAAWELCANAIEHPHPAESHEVMVEGRALARGIRVKVRDPGTWDGTACARADRGLGLPLVMGLVDRLAIRRGTGETEVVLFRCTEEP